MFRYASLFCFVVSLTLAPLLAWSANGRSIAPIVSTDWLLQNLDTPNLVVLDVRPAADYEAGHIPGALSEPFVVPFSVWITMRDDLLLEIPEQADLFAAIGNMGITSNSQVVLITAPNPGEPPHYGMSAATRAADTLIYAGVRNVAILDGGHTKWQLEQKPLSTEQVSPQPVAYTGTVAEHMFVSQDYVLRNAWRARLIDARDADVYFGAVTEPFADKPGHIFSAVSLPAPWAYATAEDGTYPFRDRAILAEMAAGVLRPAVSRRTEIIVYCGVGGYSSVWWYLLHEVLGYEHVKFYDGSAQEWALSYEMVPYQWR